MERFEQLKCLGHGAQGTVILVRRKVDGSQFVIKRIFTEESVEAQRQEVMNEIRVLALVAHPNIVGYFGSFMEDDVLNVVMEYADSGSLFERIQLAKQPLAESEILSIYAQLLLALEHLHAKHIIHRDLKTKNIFLTSNQHIKLGDFGLSKVLGSGDFAESAVGTPYYLSPELCEGKPYNSKSDVWALGCVLCELTTFKHAFDATSLPALVMSILNGDYTPIPISYSEDLHNVIQQCLQKKPEDRPNVRKLLEMAFVLPYVDKYGRESREEMRRNSQGGEPRPYFEFGTVETALSRRKARQRKSQGDLTTILDEVEQEEQFARLVTQMRASLEVRDRVHCRIPYFQCFVGKDMADYLMQQLQLETREEAVISGQRWMNAGVFYGITNATHFEDGGALYRFKEDEPGSVLNVKKQWEGAVRVAAVIEAETRMLLGQIVDQFASDNATLIDYEALAVSSTFQEYTTLTEEFQKVDLNVMPFNMKIAFFINIYNALVLHGFVVLGPPTGSSKCMHFFNHTCYNVGGLVYSLNDIAHGVLRGNQKPYGVHRRMFHRQDPRLKSAVVVWDARIHFALVSGRRSCPSLLVFSPQHIEAQLDACTRDFCARHVEVTPPMLGKTNSKTKVLLPAVFEHYREDFTGPGAGGDVLRWVLGYLPPLKAKVLKAALEDGSFIVKTVPVEWSLNKKHRTPPPMSPTSLSPLKRV